VEPGGVEPPTS